MRKNAGVLASFLILLVAAVIGSCARPYHEETERYVFVYDDESSGDGTTNVPGVTR